MTNNEVNREARVNPLENLQGFSQARALEGQNNQQVYIGARMRLAVGVRTEQHDALGVEFLSDSLA